MPMNILLSTNTPEFNIEFKFIKYKSCRIQSSNDNYDRKQTKLNIEGSFY